MPYLKPLERCKFDTETDLLASNIQDEGQLNYVITSICKNFVRRHNSPIRYADYNTVIGALECAKLEMYRRAVARYEDQKLKENGDVYDKI